MEAVGLLILRLGAGGLMLCHGWPKLMKVFAGEFEGFPDPIGLGSTLSLISAAAAEVGGSLLVIVGLLTRFGAASVVFTMAVGVLVVHANDPWLMGAGKSKEPALFYMIAFLTIVFTGAGKFSVDANLQERKKSKTGI